MHFVVPGPLTQRTGGYIYDRRIVEGLTMAGWAVQVHQLEGHFPDVDDQARMSAAAAVETMRDGLAIIDGLALPAFDRLIDRLPSRWIGLIHHPLSLETGLSPAETAAFAALEKRLMQGAARLIVTSPRTKRDLLEFDVDAEKVGVVVPGVDAAEPAAGTGGGRTRPRSLLAVGSLTRRKGYPVLLAALARLAHLDWSLRIVGSAAWDPSHAADLMAVRGDLGLDDRVDMVGEQDEAGLEALYHQADLFVLASHHEGYGMVLAEALARGLPIVSTSAGAIPDVVPDGAGRLVPPDDVEALAAALGDVLTKPQLYQALRAGALHVRQTLPDWAETTARFAGEIEESMRL